MKSISLMLLAAVLTTACAGMATIGSQPDEIPPRLVRNADGSIGWDRPSAFGPVPQAQLARGGAACATMDSKTQQYRVLGFHPAAQDLQGQTLAGGGFYCVLR